MAGEAFTILVTIDGNTTNDDNALACDRAHLPGYMSHMSIEEGTRNLLNAGANVQHGIAQIYGHGNYGQFGMGSGTAVGDETTEVMVGGKNWQQYFAPFKHLNCNIYEISIFACYTGGHDEGKALLNEMAEVSGCIVGAPIGVCSCGDNGIQYEGWEKVFGPGKGIRAPDDRWHHWPGGIPEHHLDIQGTMYERQSIPFCPAEELLSSSDKIHVRAVTRVVLTTQSGQSREPCLSG